MVSFKRNRLNYHFNLIRILGYISFASPFSPLQCLFQICFDHLALVKPRRNHVSSQFLLHCKFCLFFSFPFQTLHVAPRSVPQFKSYEDEPESAPTPSSTSSGASSREHTFTRPIQHVNAPVSASAVKSRMTSGSGARASMRAGSAHTNFPKSEPGKYNYILSICICSCSYGVGEFSRRLGTTQAWHDCFSRVVGPSNL